MHDYLLAGTSAGILTQLHQRLTQPRPGDWVVEKTRGWHLYEPTAVGRLIHVGPGLQPVVPEAPPRTLWHLESLDGALVRWASADFLALPTWTLLAGEPLPEVLAEEERERAAWVRQARERHGLTEYLEASQ